MHIDVKIRLCLERRGTWKATLVLPALPRTGAKSTLGGALQVRAMPT